MEAPTDGDATCVWQLRDRDGWRHGVVFSGSADLLTAWHTALVTMSPGSRAAADNQFGILVDKVRQARLSDSADEVESACRALLHHVASHPAPARMRQALVDLRDKLTWVAPSTGACLLGSGCLCADTVAMSPDRQASGPVPGVGP